MRKILFFTTLFAFVLTSSAWAADIPGTWTITQKNNEGAEDSFDVAIKAAGGNFTITGNHSKIGALSGTAALKGDAITMTINAVGAEGKGALSFAYTGKVTGNKMSGTKETKMSGTPGGGQASAGGQGGASAGGGQAPAGGGQVPAGGQAPAGGGQTPAGGQGAPQGMGGQAPAGGQGAPSMAQGGAPGASGGAPDAVSGTVSKEWTAVKK